MLCTFNDEVDGGGKPTPAFSFFFKLRASRGGERIKPGLAAGFGLIPSGAYPPLLLQAVQSRIKRALLHLQDILRYLLNAFGNGPAVLGFERDRLEYEQIKGALLHEIAWFPHTVIIYTGRV